MTTRTYTNRRYLDALNQRVLVFDGAMGTSLQKQNLTAADFGGEKYNGCNDFLVISRPEAVEKVHRSFLEVGVDVLETDTFRSNRLTMGEYGLAERVLEINRAAASLARRLADEFAAKTGQPRFVAGSIGPSGKLPSADDPELSNMQFDELADLFREQAIGLLQGGVDVILIETSQDILEVKAAIHGVTQAFAETGIWLPIQAQITLDTTGRMLLGTDAQAAIAILEELPIDVIGVNCSTGPEHMREPIEILGEQTRLPVSCIPNAGLPLNVDGQAVYPLEPEPFAAALYEFVERNHVSVVGGCCGTTPEHLKKLVEKIHGLSHPQRPAPENARLASGIKAMNMHQDPAPFLIGERCNAQGSRAFKRMILAEDWDGVLTVARDQLDKGAHGLDISVAVTERGDEPYLMRQVVRKLVTAGIDLPLVIDSTEVDVLEVALKTAPGRCLINSTHLESGRAKADKIFALAKTYNAAVITLTIDEQGMAKTRERKLEVARRIYDIAVNEHGLRPDALVFDDLTFTLATGDPEFSASAIETIEGIRLIKEALPGVLTSLGVSNLSFGLSANARPTLNSVMLYHCVRAGLDMAIINPAHVRPYAEISPAERDLAEDLIFNRRPDALQRYIEYFDVNTGSVEATSQADPTEGMTVAERLHWRILARHKENIEADVDEIIAQGTQPSKHETAVHVLNTVLLPAMKEVGDKFGAGELILPFVLQSAEVMKKAVARLETYLEKQEGVTKGTVVLATVYGDVHDIGKNLVKTILSNNGYTVVDLGKQTPAETIISKAVEINATAIGLSALLVSTSKQMPLIINELQRRGLNFPVLIGGAAINRRFGRRILFTEEGQPYAPGVFYCKDAFEGLETMDALIVPEKRADLRTKIQKEAEMEVGRAAAAQPQAPKTGERSAIIPAPIALPEKLGERLTLQMPLEIIFRHLNLNELYRLSWGAKNTHGAEWEKLKAEFDARLEQMKKAALREKWLAPQAVYGFFPCQADGDDLIIYNPADLRFSASQSAPESAAAAELTRFHFPRQPYDEHLALSDYFAPVDSGKMDVVAFQIVTVGQAATEKFEKLQAENNFSEAYFTHGLAVQTAEATAAYLHNHIRRELGIAEEQGKRYSWGYPAIPELEDHRKVFDLLPGAEKVLGMTLSPAYQLIPEQSTAAIILHHKNAKYYSVGESRVEQLMR
ncbi:MAG: methionine synthase [Anaerolineae bacterium CG_4_9_14_3_um_filter_57_17]|nr:methionine synthase [bacterium]NCT20452.1 methionine synthase [bacterium]OIO83974.1 MAG: methionine synthase [Anaerolineae bacterium CG2_30_57_67]PJB65078.1 MAG: methionine synthase [Anaerolineae bacterium CG_4_9_14_3_um_filter_57_17]